MNHYKTAVIPGDFLFHKKTLAFFTDATFRCLKEEQSHPKSQYICKRNRKEDRK